MKKIVLALLLFFLQYGSYSQPTKLTISSEQHKKHKWNNARYNYFLKDAGGNIVASFEDYKFMEDYLVPGFFLIGAGQPTSYGRSKYIGLVDAITGQFVVPPTATHIEKIGSCIIYASMSGGGGSMLIKIGTPYTASTYEWVKTSRPQNKEEWQTMVVKTGGKWGYIDTCGNTLIAPRYDEADLLINGSGRVRLGDKWMLLDANLKEISNTRHNYIGYRIGNFYPYNSSAPLDVYGKPQGKLGLLNTRGEKMSEEVYDEFMITNEGLTAKMDGQWIKINPQNNNNSSTISATAAVPQVKEEFHKQSKWGYSKYGYTIGSEVLVKPKYDKAYPFQGRFAVVGNEGKDKIITFGGNEARATEYGLLNLKGQEVIPTRYKALWPYQDGMYGFAIGKDYESSWRYGIMDTSGKIIVPAEFLAIGALQDGLIVAKKGVQYGYINLTGNVIIPFSYKYATTFINGKASVADADNKWYWIDKNGKELMPGRRFVSVSDWDSSGKAWTWNKLDKWNRPDSALQITLAGNIVASRPLNGPPVPPPPGRTRCSQCNGSGFAYKSRDVESSFTWRDGMFKPVTTNTTYSYSYKVYEKDGACPRCGGDGYE